MRRTEGLIETPGAPGGLAQAPGEMARQAHQTLGRAVDHLRALQDPEGWWKGELETNVTMDAEDLLLREFLGIRSERETAESARWIRSCQRADGTWAAFHGGPPELSTTVEAYVALRLAGDHASAPHMERAAAYVRDAGGVEATRVFTRIWLALFGLWDWERLPVLPPELLLLPSWMPLNVYDFGCWARQTVVALTVVGTYRPVRRLPVEVPELFSGRVQPPAERGLGNWAGRFQLLDDVLHRYARRPLRPLRRLALDRAEAWIVARQEADGSWGGIQPPWVYSLMALHLRGYALDHPVMEAGLKGLEAFTIHDERGRRLEACQSPVWDTALAVTALADAGVGGKDPALRSAAAWLLDQEVRVPGDWSVRRPQLAPGGWAFEFANDHYPDVDDSAEVAMAVARVEIDGADAVERALDWMLGMQCRDGGWGAFDVDNTRALCRELPFCDFGELIDPPSADVTAHAVEALAVLGRAPERAASGVRWLLRAQEADGSWFGRWGANHVYGTGAVVPALVAAGVAPGHPSIRRAVAWLHDHQNPDGGWGEDLRSYDDRAWLGRGASTASQTAWALLALLAAGERDGPTIRGVDWLSRTQRDDGTWDEPWFTGTGFPGDFYINYHLYRLVFPVMALGRYLHQPVAGELPTAPATPASVDPSTVPSGPAARSAGEDVPPSQSDLWLLAVDEATARSLGVDHVSSVLAASERESSARRPRAPVALIGTSEAPEGSGRLVVGTDLRAGGKGPGPARRHVLAGANLLASELRRCGLVAEEATFVVDPGIGADCGNARLALEPATFRALRSALGPRPLAVVQGGDAATLAAARPALERWAGALGERRVVLAAPRSFCAGVERAIETVERALERFGPPVYVRRQIVHNAHVVRDLSERGAVFVEELDEVPVGAVAVLAAHGVSPEVRAEADGRSGMTVIDATCPLVAKVHHEARRFVAQGYKIVLIGHAGHEEVVGTLGEAPQSMVLVESTSDVDRLAFEPEEPVAYLTQTTLSVDETAAIVHRLEERFPNLEGPSTEDICYATQNRQDAVRALAPECDLMLVIGSSNSSNTRRLVEVATQAGCRAELIEDASELELGWLSSASTVGVTAGASAPESLVREVVDALGQLGEVEETERRTVEEDVRFALPRQVR